MNPKSKASVRRMISRAENMEPRLITANGSSVKRDIASSVLPDGASLTPMSKKADTFSPWSGSAYFSGSGGSSSFHTQRPYLPEFDSPERQFYPYDRCEANKYWRMFYKFDPFFGTAVDMYSQMMVSDFDIVLENSTDQTIKNQLMDMSQDTNLLDKIQTMVKEFLVLGEALPHCFFDEEKGVWSYIGFHDPDYIDIQDSPIIDMDPIISFIPDSKLKGLLTDNSPEAVELRKRLPNEFVSRVLANQKIRLSPVNCSYIPRKLHPYDERGVSLASRLWRIWMVEDAVYNSTIATFRRHASPIKTLKLGDPSTGWIPDPSTEGDLLRLLAQAEMDPNAWLVTHYGVNFEAWGTNDRAITLSREHDTIEKVKLLALGLSKSFMTGEVTYASSYDTSVRLFDGSYTNIETIEIGNSVIDRFGKAQKVTDVLKYPSPDKMVKITTYGNRELTLTDNHELPVFARPHKCLCGCGEDLGDRKITSQGRMKWKSFSPQHHKLSKRGGRDRKYIDYKHNDKVIVSFPEEHQPYQRLQASEVRVGDWLMIPRKFEDSGVEVSKDNLSKARLLGYYVAEGSMYKNERGVNHPLKFSFGLLSSDKETFYSNDVCSKVESLNYKATIRTDSGKYTVCLPAKSFELSSWLVENGGIRSHSKKLSKEVMGCNLELKKELLKGMYRGDGYLFKKGNRLDVVYTTVSYQLMRQLEVILTQLGYSCYVHTSDERIDKKGSVHKECYYITCAGKQAKSLAELIWGDVPCVWDSLDWNGFEDGNKGQRSQVFVDEDYVYVPVNSVDLIEVDKEAHPHVYSLTVDSTNSYTLDNIASFNSAKSGLQVFLRRLLSLRQFFEKTWILPKFFGPIIAMNDWTKSTPAEVNHRIKIKRTAQEAAERGLLITPKIKWRNKLDPSVDSETLQAYGQLKNFGFDISNDTIGSAVSLNWEDEIRKKAVEFKKREEILQNTLGTQQKQKFEEQAQPKPPGGAGSGAKPPSSSAKQAPGGKPTSTPPGSNDSGGVSDEAIETPSEGMADTIQ